MYNIFNLSHQYIIRRKWLPLINCLSSAPSGAFSFPLIAATSSPTWSLMMMPIHTSKAEKNAATSSTTGNAEIMRVFISSTVQYCLHTTSSTHHFLITSFLFDHIYRPSHYDYSFQHAIITLFTKTQVRQQINKTGQGWLNVPVRAQMVLALHGLPTRVWKHYKYGYGVRQFLKNKVTIRWVQQLNNYLINNIFKYILKYF